MEDYVKCHVKPCTLTQVSTKQWNYEGFNYRSDYLFANVALLGALFQRSWEQFVKSFQQRMGHQSHVVQFSNFLSDIPLKTGLPITIV